MAIYIMSLESNVSETLIKENLEQFLIVLSVSLSVATLSRIFSWFRQIPYTLLLVIVGLGLAFVDIRLVNLSPELILEIFLPPLLFEAAWNIRWRALLEDWLPISLYAVFGVVISVLGIGLSLSYFTALPLSTALLVGASLSATDPVSVIALFRELGASKRLTVLMEGESLFNDGVAVVAFLLLVGIPLGTSDFSVPNTIARFFAVVGIGVGVGVLIGFGISYLTQRFDLPLVEQSLTLVAAYGTYLVTEELGGSGVIGVVTVGLILGNFGSRIGMNPRTRLLVSDFWEFLAFFVNSIVFLLIGDQIQIMALLGNSRLIMVAIAAVLLTRFLSILGLGFISDAISSQAIDWRDKMVLWWGGLRGSVSIALALSVPVSLQGRQEIIETVFGVVLFTLMIQGLTTKSLLERLNLISSDQGIKQEYFELTARLVAFRRILEYLGQMQVFPEYDSQYYAYQEKLVQGQLKNIEEKLQTLRRENPELRKLTAEQVNEKLIDIEAETYAEFIRAGRLNNNLSPLLQDVIVKSFEDEDLM